MENGYVESFNGRFRDECLNENWFCDLADAREKIAHWKQDYNQARPHSALGYRTPEEFAKAAATSCGKDGGSAIGETIQLPRARRNFVVLQELPDRGSEVASLVNDLIPCLAIPMPLDNPAGDGTGGLGSVHVI